ncbi:MAG: FhaA domain-containing protein [Acidimicrobiia bacterium]
MIAAMNMIRRLERRLESMLDGVVGTVFRGQLHPSELAGRIIREADLTGVQTQDGTVVPNRYVLVVNPDDLEGHSPPPELRHELAVLVEELALERGWRLEGPAEVVVITNREVTHGSPRCDGQFVEGPRAAWARLVGDTTIAVTVNRAVVGRGSEADVTIPSQHVSRRHALLWKQDGRLMVQDLGSSNGTRVDGVRVDHRPTEVPTAAVLTFGDTSYRFVEAI